MTVPGGADALFHRMADTVGTWTEARRHRAGLDLCVGDPAQLRQGRRKQARSVLAAAALLDELSEDGPGPMVLMKGLEVAQLYPACTYRPFRDVDLLLESPDALWQGLVARGFRSSPKRRYDIDHHHLPALVAPRSDVGLELHHRPNVPTWSGISTQLVLDTAEPSRTGAPGLLRPRDDIHALLMALHCWKGGFVRVRDLFDALLLAEASVRPVELTAREHGLERFWTWTRRFAEGELFGHATRRTRSVARVLLPEVSTRSTRTRSRLLAPYLVKGPLRVTRAHLGDYRLGRAARTLPPARPGVNRPE